MSSRAVVAGVAAVSLTLAAVGTSSGEESEPAAAVARQGFGEAPPPVAWEPEVVGPLAPVVEVPAPVSAAVEERGSAVRVSRAVRPVARKASPATAGKRAPKRVVKRSPRPATKPDRKVVKHQPRKRAGERRAPQRWATPRAARGMQAAVAFARAQVGDAYRKGANGPNVWDCSSLMQAAYGRAGVKLPRISHAQGRRGRAVPRSQRQVGDLMYWSSGHVAIYVGGGQMIDAGKPSTGVVHRRVWGSPQYRRF